VNIERIKMLHWIVFGTDATARRERALEIAEGAVKEFDFGNNRSNGVDCALLQCARDASEAPIAYGTAGRTVILLNLHLAEVATREKVKPLVESSAVPIVITTGSYVAISESVRSICGFMRVPNPLLRQRIEMAPSSDLYQAATRLLEACRAPAVPTKHLLRMSHTIGSACARCGIPFAVWAQFLVLAVSSDPAAFDATILIAHHEVLDTQSGRPVLLAWHATTMGLAELFRQHVQPEELP